MEEQEEMERQKDAVSSRLSTHLPLKDVLVVG